MFEDRLPMLYHPYTQILDLVESEKQMNSLHNDSNYYGKMFYRTGHGSFSKGACAIEMTSYTWRENDLITSGPYYKHIMIANDDRK
jgi:hypothetical protein